MIQICFIGTLSIDRYGIYVARGLITLRYRSHEDHSANVSDARFRFCLERHNEFLRRAGSYQVSWVTRRRMSLLCRQSAANAALAFMTDCGESATYFELPRQSLVSILLSEYNGVGMTLLHGFVPHPSPLPPMKQTLVARYL